MKKSTWEESLDTALRMARWKFKSLDPERVAENAGGYLRDDGNIIEIDFCNIKHFVIVGDAVIIDRWKRPIPITREILIFHYLNGVDGTEPTGKWVDFRYLPGGDAYFPVFKKRIVYPILGLFASEPEGLIYASRSLGGEKVDVGDVGVKINVFPRVPIVFFIWKGDEEFQPDGGVLFDETIRRHLSTEDAIVACQETISLLKLHAWKA